MQALDGKGPSAGEERCRVQGTAKKAAACLTHALGCHWPEGSLLSCLLGLFMDHGPRQGAAGLWEKKQGLPTAVGSGHWLSASGNGWQ